MELSARRGPDVDGERPPLVLLHGFCLNAGLWAGQLDGLGRRWPTVALDLRGFGSSVPVQDDRQPSIEVMADDVAETLRLLGRRPAIVCGLSMGGYVAMALARRAPELLAGLVLADTKQEADDEARRAERERVASTVERERSVRVVLEEVAPSFTGATTRRRRPEAQALVDTLVAATPYEAAAWASRAMAGREDSAATLRALEAPVLVVVGDEDVVSPPAGAFAMASGLRDGSFACLPTAGHLSPAEVAPAFDACVASFLEARFGEVGR